MGLTAGWLAAQVNLPRFGFYDLTSGDTFRLNVTNVGNPSTPIDPCRVTAFVQGPGPTPLCGDGSCFLVAPTTLALAAGQSGGLEFASLSTLTAWPILTLPAGQPIDPCRNVTASVEVYDTATKRTRLLDLGRRLIPPSPVQIPPNPIFPLAGLTASDTMRINLVYQPLGPPISPAPTCTVQAAIQGSDGTTLNTTTVTLSPFQFTSLSYTGNASRPLVRAVIFSTPTDPCRNVLATVELLDSVTNRTYALTPPGPPI